jgi:hypothetical protein
MSITAYNILVANNTDKLVDAVSTAIGDSWQPYQNIFVTDKGKMAQCVIQGVPDGGGIPAGAVVVQTGDTVQLGANDGTGFGSGTADVTDSVLQVNLPATTAPVNDQDVVQITNSAGADSHSATATVASGAITSVKFAATIAMVDNADTVAVHNSAGTNVVGSHAAEVALGVLTDVKLAATVAPVVNGGTLTGVTPSGVYTNTITFTVSGGVITAVALS